MKLYNCRCVALPVLALVVQLCAFITVNQVQGQIPRRDETFPPPAFLKKLNSFHIICIEKTGVSEESIRRFSDADIHDDEALKCYMNCLFHEIGLVDDGGEVHNDKVKAYLPDDLKLIFTETMDNCDKQAPEDGTQCDRAWARHACWKKTDPVHYFLPV